VKYDKDNYIHITYKNIMSAIRYNMPTMRNFGVTFENLTCTHHPNWEAGGAVVSYLRPCPALAWRNIMISIPEFRRGTCPREFVAARRP
jgi:hypothetical protein